MYHMRSYFLLIKLNTTKNHDFWLAQYLNVLQIKQLYLFLSLSDILLHWSLLCLLILLLWKPIFFWDDICKHVSVDRRGYFLQMWVVRCGWDVAVCLRTWHLLCVCVAPVWREPPRKWKAGFTWALVSCCLHRPSPDTIRSGAQSTPACWATPSTSIKHKVYPYGKNWDLVEPKIYMLFICCKL